MVLTVILVTPPARAADAQAAGASGVKRTAKQVAEEIQAAGQELAPLFNSPQDLFDARRREAAAPKAIPALRRMVRLLEEFQTMRPVGTAEGQERIQLLALASALGDKDADEKLKKMAASAAAAEAAAGRSARLTSRWMQTNGDAPEQEKVLADLEALAKEHPSQDAVGAAAIMLAGTTRPEAKEQRHRIRKLLTDHFKGPAGPSLTKQLDLMERKMEVAARLRALEGKPLTLEGIAADGSTFSTAAWRGKVVLVDFWATWCGPCKEELPRLKQAHAKYHDQGLEVLGVSCDNSADDLRKFLSQNKDMPWPQLFDKSKPGWHPLASRYHINVIPAMFLIDRRGIVRSVEARANYETLIPELLKERAQ